jgi:hypothetical protein
MNLLLRLNYNFDEVLCTVFVEKLDEVGTWL